MREFINAELKCPLLLLWSPVCKLSWLWWGFWTHKQKQGFCPTCWLHWQHSLLLPCCFFFSSTPQILEWWYKVTSKIRIYYASWSITHAKGCQSLGGAYRSLRITIDLYTMQITSPGENDTFGECINLLTGLPTSRWQLEILHYYNTSPEDQDQFPRRKRPLWKVASVASNPAKVPHLSKLHHPWAHPSQSPGIS